MEELIKRLERVIQTGVPNKDGMHPISAEAVLEVVNELSEHGTNLAEVGTDYISRQAAIEALVSMTIYTKEELKEYREESAYKDCWTNGIYDAVEKIEQLPPIQPDNGLQKLADEIASFKRHVKSENSDYLTGYLCALSVVEGMIADMRGKQDG